MTTKIHRYEEIATVLRERIARGDYADGRLDSERRLQEEFGVQRATVRRALETLMADGVIFRHRTKGTFTMPPPPRPSSLVGGIALVVGRAADTTAPQEIARGLAGAVSADGRPVLWLDASASPGHAEAAVPDPSDLLARGVAGVALWPQVPADTARLRALQRALPVVLLDRRVLDLDCDFVGTDDVDAGQQITRHLIERGHRRIGFLSSAPQASSVQAREKGWRAALTAAGVNVPYSWARAQTLDLARLDTAGLNDFLLDGEGGPLTAVVCSNDTIAANLMRWLRDSRGLHVPGDMAVTGFGNSLPSLLDALGLTTMAQSWEEIGRAAGELLLSRLSGDLSPTPREIELPATLLARASSGGPS